MARRRTPPPLDPFERAARRSDPEYARLAEVADATPPSALRAPKLLLGFLLVVLATALVRGGHGSTAPLKRSCTTPGFALDDARVSYDATLRWSATGPPADSVVLGLDGADAVPAEPVAGPTPLTGCLVHGTFPVQARKGSHTLTAYIVSPDGSVVTRLSKTLTVE